jgi:hypothetical protein
LRNTQNLAPRKLTGSYPSSSRGPRSTNGFVYADANDRVRDVQSNPTRSLVRSAPCAGSAANSSITRSADLRRVPLLYEIGVHGQLSRAAWASLALMRASADDPARSPEAMAKQKAKARAESRAAAAWEPEHGRGSAEAYEREVLRRIRLLTVRDLMKVTGLSQFTAGRCGRASAGCMQALGCDRGITCVASVPVSRSALSLPD